MALPANCQTVQASLWWLRLAHDWLPSALQMSRAGLLSFWLVAQSNTHPAFRDGPPLVPNMELSDFPDPTTQGMNGVWLPYVKALEDTAWAQAMMVSCWGPCPCRVEGESWRLPLLPSAPTLL